MFNVQCQNAWPPELQQRRVKVRVVLPLMGDCALNVKAICPKDFEARQNRINMKREKYTMSKKRVMVVDDEQAILHACQRMLELHNYEVKTASGVNSAKKILGHKNFELIISDICLKGEFGIDLLRHVKKTYPGIGVIMMTGTPDAASEEECRREGAFDYLHKPFEMSEFLFSIDNFFGSSKK